MLWLDCFPIVGAEDAEGVRKWTFCAFGCLLKGNFLYAVNTTSLLRELGKKESSDASVRELFLVWEYDLH